MGRLTQKPVRFVLAVVFVAGAVGCGNTFFIPYGGGALLKKPTGKGLVIPTTIMAMDTADMVGRALPRGLPQFQWSTPEESMVKLRADPVAVGELSDIDLSTPHDDGLSKVEFQKLARAGYSVGETSSPSSASDTSVNHRTERYPSPTTSFRCSPSSFSTLRPARSPWSSHARPATNQTSRTSGSSRIWSSS